MKVKSSKVENQDSPKRCFLKKGQGIARFGVQAKQAKPIKDLKSVKPRVDSYVSQSSRRNESGSTQSSKSAKPDTQQNKITKGDNKPGKLGKVDNSLKTQKGPVKEDGPGGVKKRAVSSSF